MTAGQVDQVIEFASLEAMEGFISSLSQMAKNYRRMEGTGIRPTLNFYIGSMPGVTVGMPGLVTAPVGEVVRSAADAHAEFQHQHKPNITHDFRDGIVPG